MARLRWATIGRTGRAPRALALAASALLATGTLVEALPLPGGGLLGVPLPSDTDPTAACADVAASGGSGPAVSWDVQHDASPPLRSVAPGSLPPPPSICQSPRADLPACPSTPDPGAPAIAAIIPAAGPVGSEVRVHGVGFAASDNAIHFGAGYIPNLPSPDGTSIVFTVPASLDPACSFAQPRCLLPSRSTEPGTYQVAVGNSNGMSNVGTFTVQPAGRP